MIEGTNQDGFIQRALNASRAYTNIIDSVNEADAAAKQANKAAMDALEVRITRNIYIYVVHTVIYNTYIVLVQSRRKSTQCTGSGV